MTAKQKSTSLDAAHYRFSGLRLQHKPLQPNRMGLVKIERNLHFHFAIFRRNEPLYLILFNYHSSTLPQVQHFDKMYVWDWLENWGGMSGDRIACLCKLYHLCSNTLHFPWQSISQGRKKRSQLVSLAVFTGGQDEFLHFKKLRRTHQNESVMLNCINWQTNIHFSPLVTWKKSEFNAAGHLNSCGGTGLE